MDNSTGNIVFFQSYGTSWWQRSTTRLVQSRTHGPFVHVAIQTDIPGQLIQSGATGVAYAQLPRDHGTYIMCQIATINVNLTTGMAQALDPDRLAYALVWARMHLGMRYGALDIVDQGLDAILPRNSLHLAQVDHYDCSNFAAAFLDKAGVWLPQSFTYPFNVSPNDLAEWFGLLPKRNRVSKFQLHTGPKE